MKCRHTLWESGRWLASASNTCVDPVVNVTMILQVIKQLTNSNKGASCAADVEDQLASLAAAAPEWLTIEKDIVGKQVVRLQRRVNSKAIRQRLLGMSGTRRMSSGAC